MEDNISDYKKHVARVNQEFEEFVYIVSHDLKAPLRAISNLSDWIQEDLSPEVGEDIHSNLKLLKNRTVRLERMLGAILEISQVSRRQLDIKESNLTELLEETIHPFINNNVHITIPC